MSTKIHLAVRGLGCPVAFHLTAGHRGDAPQAAALLSGRTASIVMADAAYDADHFRDTITALGATAVIPSNPSRTAKLAFDKHLCKEHHLIECCFSKLKQFQRVATRYNKTARNNLAVITLAATILKLQQVIIRPKP